MSFLSRKVASNLEEIKKGITKIPSKGPERTIIKMLAGVERRRGRSNFP
jgi:hypothetical protein